MIANSAKKTDGKTLFIINQGYGSCGAAGL
jgi:hypothetical protein